MEHLKIAASVYSEILHTIGRYKAESGGVFAVDTATQTIVDFYFDVDAGCGTKCYRPTCGKIERTVNAWSAEPGLSFGGFVHSHPLLCKELSAMDILCADKVIRANRLPFIYMAIVCDGLYLYKVTPATDGSEPKLTSCTFDVI